MEFPLIFLRKRRWLNILIPFISLAAVILSEMILRQFYSESQRLIFRYSLATGYIALALLALTLTIGPWNILRQKWKGQEYPVSINLRRDLGIWCAVFSLIHVLFGLNVHLEHWSQYFLDASGNLLVDLFGFANYVGVAATILVIILLITSNNIALTYFKFKKWKAIQRWNYFFIFLVFAHSIAYQIVEKRIVPFAFILGIIILWVIILQFSGFLFSKSKVSKGKG